MSERINWWNLKLGSNEFGFLQTAFEKRKISYNSVGHELEARLCKFLKVKHALLTTSGSASLLIALKILGVNSNDEVIVPNRTFQATANAVLMAGAKVHLVDVDPERATLNASQLEAAITPQTKGVISVHLNGRACEIDKVLSVCRQHKLFLIEDAAQAFASADQGRFLGTIGDVGCFSMGTTKFLTSGQGGFLVTDNTDLYEKAKRFIYQGYEGTDDKKFSHLGFNFRLSDLLSSLALSQMDQLFEKKDRFISVYKKYQAGLSDSKIVQLIPFHENRGEVPIWVEALSPLRDPLFNRLKEKGIDAYKFYPSLHRSAYLFESGFGDQYFPASELFESQGLILPCGPDISEAEVSQVIEEINLFEASFLV